MIMRKIFLVFLLAVLALTTSGCQAAKGIGDDVYNTWQMLKKADAWMQENYW